MSGLVRVTSRLPKPKSVKGLRARSGAKIGFGNHNGVFRVMQGPRVTQQQVAPAVDQSHGPLHGPPLQPPCWLAAALHPFCYSSFPLGGLLFPPISHPTTPPAVPDQSQPARGSQPTNGGSKTGHMAPLPRQSHKNHLHQFHDYFTEKFKFTTTG